MYTDMPHKDINTYANTQGEQAKRMSATCNSGIHIKIQHFADIRKFNTNLSNRLFRHKNTHHPQKAKPPFLNQNKKKPFLRFLLYFHPGSQLFHPKKTPIL